MPHHRPGLLLVTALCLGACDVGGAKPSASNIPVVLSTIMASPNAAGTSSSGPFAASFKGWELYSWEDSGLWRFSLMNGTNALKTWAQIGVASSTENGVTAMEGLAALEAQLARLPKGSEVFWNAGSGEGDLARLKYPPAADRERLILAAAKLGVTLTITGL